MQVLRMISLATNFHTLFRLYVNFIFRSYLLFWLSYYESKVSKSNFDLKLEKKANYER